MNWEDSAQSFESSLMIMRKDKNGWVIGFSVHPNEVPNALLNVPLGTRFQQVLFQLGDDESPVPTEENIEGKQAVSRAGQICRELEFQQWILKEKAPSEEGAKEELCKMIGIESRSELQSNAEARKRFDQIMEDYRSFTIDIPF